MNKNGLIYDVEDKPKANKLILLAFQQVLAILAATIAVPSIINLPMQIPAAILGAGVGTIVYLLFTRFKSPVFLGSSFAFLSSLSVATLYGYCGILVGSIFAGLVYVIIAIIIHFAGTKWVSKLMPPVIIGPTVALIGLSLAGAAMGDIVSASGIDNLTVANVWADSPAGIVNGGYNLVALLCGLVAFITIVICSSQKKFKTMKLIPFIIGIGAGYLCASIFSIIGYTADVEYLKIINWAPLVKTFVNKDGAFAGVTAFLNYPRFGLIEAIKEIADKGVSADILTAAAKNNNGAAAGLLDGAGVATVAIAFIPVALVVFAEHIADHKNLGSIIGRDLVEGEPGLEKTLLGDGVGSIAGTIFGICPNTTYGESVGCVAITKNASIRTIFVAALMCIGLSFLSPVMAILQTIPSCVMGGVCLTLYGFIAVSGLKMFKEIDLGDNKNLFTVSAILIAGIGGLSINIPYAIHQANIATTGFTATGEEVELFGKATDGSLYPLFVALKGQPQKVITITAIATALILGICVYAIMNAIEKRNAKIAPDAGEEDAPESLIAGAVAPEVGFEVGGTDEAAPADTTDSNE